MTREEDDFGGVFHEVFVELEKPSASAELRIYFADPKGRRAMVAWHRDTDSLISRQAYGRDGSQRIRKAISTVLRRSPLGLSSGQPLNLDELPAGSTTATLTALTAFYLAAEKARSGELAYDVDEGLQRFSAWLDDHTE